MTSPVIKVIQSELSSLYSFEVEYRVEDFIVNKPIKNRYNACTLFKVNDNQLDISVYIPTEVERIASETTRKSISSIYQLNALSIYIEEISHFHMIINCVKDHRPFRLIELEWQAEIDKIIVLGSWLDQITGQPHWESLEDLIFRKSKILVPKGEDHLRYENASKEAHRFWLDLKTFTNGSIHSWNHLKDYLGSTYRLPWEAKKVQTLNRNSNTNI